MERTRYHQSFHGDILADHGISSVSPTRDFHMHDHYELFLFLGGRVNGFVEQYSYPLARGDMLIFNNHEIHKIINLSPEPYERITVHFKAPLIYPLCTADTNLLACFQNRHLGAGNLVRLEEAQLTAYTGLAHRLIGLLRQPRYGGDVLALAVLAELLVMAGDIYSRGSSAVPGPIPALIQSAMAYIDDHLHTALSLEQIAKDLSVDRHHLSRLFKQQTGGTLYRYILLKKIAVAKQLLTAGTSVSETCYLSGFNDYANFIRTFKNITGSSPGQYGKTLS